VDGGGLNPLLAKLQPYPFEKLRALMAGHTPNAALRPINLSIGEPKHPTPPRVKNALAEALEGLARLARQSSGRPSLPGSRAAMTSRRRTLRPRCCR
jgi:N-succinyldiaminopimelate aminotransferase